jgi:surfeit locus 1 family protein
MSYRESSRFPWALVLSGLPVFVVLIALGNWQQNRLEWKTNLVAAIEDRSRADPRPLDDVVRLFGETGDIDYLPVTVEGRFLHEYEAHFLATHMGRSGWHVYTPLARTGGSLVMVNRGFVPYRYKNAGTREQGQVAGLVTINGLARSPRAGKPSTLVPENDERGNTFYWKDLPAMLARTGEADERKFVPFFVDADKTANPGGLPVGGVTRKDLPNNHLQYALTWYGLAVALLGVMGTFLWRWNRDR